MIYNVIGTGSSGNSVIYHDRIMVDCGVSYSLIEPYIKDIGIVLLTHQHLDHIKVSILIKMQSERPGLRVGCPEWMLRYTKGIRAVDVYEMDIAYNYGQFTIRPFELSHDVPNCGYKIECNGHKLIHATDCAHLEGISAKDYDLFALEYNYDHDFNEYKINDKTMKGEYSYEKRVANAHLSHEQAVEFYFKNKKETSELLRLHESSNI